MSVEALRWAYLEWWVKASFTKEGVGELAPALPEPDRIKARDRFRKWLEMWRGLESAEHGGELGRTFALRGEQFGAWLGVDIRSLVGLIYLANDALPPAPTELGVIDSVWDLVPLKGSL